MGRFCMQPGGPSVALPHPSNDVWPSCTPEPAQTAATPMDPEGRRRWCGLTLRGAGMGLHWDLSPTPSPLSSALPLRDNGGVPVAPGGDGS